MSRPYLLMLFGCSIGLAAVLKSSKFLPETNMTVCQMAHYYGYPCEVHEVKTEDGYLLKLQRIPFGLKIKPLGRVVFLQHGFLDSAATWVMNLPHQSLAYILADAGYDVWLGNSRGNMYCEKHVKYTVGDKEFWNFSFDEMAKYDLPASINFVYNTTNKSLYYVGHSQGATIGFIGLSTNPSLERKIKALIAMSPIATVSYVSGAMEILCQLAADEEYAKKRLADQQFLPSKSLYSFLDDLFCDSMLFGDACKNMMFLLSGFNLDYINSTRLPVYFSHAPAGTSGRNIMHYSQIMMAQKFQMFDHGVDGNMKRYGQEHPPLYNLTEIRNPVVLFAGDDDLIANPDDMEIFKTLPLVCYRRTLTSWTYLDFVWGTRANVYVYQDILEIIEVIDEDSI